MKKKDQEFWTPDFYLPELGIYIEVCGSENFNYEYRAQIYKKNRIPIIFVHCFKEENNWKEYLRKRIAEINEFRAKKVTDSLLRR